MITKPGKIYGIAFVAVLGSFLFGYDTTVISGAVESLNGFSIVPLWLSEGMGNTLLGFIIAYALIGCVFGSAVGGYFSRNSPVSVPCRWLPCLY